MCSRPNGSESGAYQTRLGDIIGSGCESAPSTPTGARISDARCNDVAGFGEETPYLDEVPAETVGLADRVAQQLDRRFPEEFPQLCATRFRFFLQRRADRGGASVVFPVGAFDCGAHALETLAHDRLGLGGLARSAREAGLRQSIDY